jgi:hypothetical protein
MDIEQAAVETSAIHGTIIILQTSSNKQQQAATSSNKQQQAATSSNKQQQAATSSNKQQQV